MPSPGSDRSLRLVPNVVANPEHALDGFRRFVLACSAWQRTTGQERIDARRDARAALHTMLGAVLEAEALPSPDQLARIALEEANA